MHILDFYKFMYNIYILTCTFLLSKVSKKTELFLHVDKNFIARYIYGQYSMVAIKKRLSTIK